MVKAQSNKIKGLNAAKESSRGATTEYMYDVNRKTRKKNQQRKYPHRVNIAREMLLCAE